MAGRLSGIEWTLRSSLDHELRLIKYMTPESERTADEMAVIKYFETRLEEFEKRLEKQYDN